MPIVFACSLFRLLQMPAAGRRFRKRCGGFLAPAQAPSSMNISTNRTLCIPCILAQRGRIGYNRRLLLSLFHDQPSGASQAHLNRFLNEDVLARLRQLDDRARRGGIAALNPTDDPLIPLGMEIDGAGRVTKNCYGVFNLSWQAEMHPEWPDRVATEVQDIRQCAREIHNAPLKHLIWAGMGGSIEDKSMYSAVGLLDKGLRFYALDSTDPSS
jgi:hypothetical protein